MKALSILQVSDKIKPFVSKPEVVAKIVGNIFAHNIKMCKVKSTLTNSSIEIISTFTNNVKVRKSIVSVKTGEDITRLL